jgi:hypothetical protein
MLLIVAQNPQKITIERGFWLLKIRGLFDKVRTLK